MELEKLLASGRANPVLAGCVTGERLEHRRRAHALGLPASTSPAALAAMELDRKLAQQILDRVECRSREWLTEGALFPVGLPRLTRFDRPHTPRPVVNLHIHLHS